MTAMMNPLPKCLAAYSGDFGNAGDCRSGSIIAAIVWTQTRSGLLAA